MNGSLAMAETPAFEPDFDAGPLKFDRRCGDRWPVQCAATAFRLSGEGFGRLHELCVTDMAHEAMGAISDTAVEPGSTVTVGFENPGYLARRGTVVRCVPCGNGYRVAVRFDRRLAA
jgi:hypothetical protein